MGRIMVSHSNLMELIQQCRTETNLDIQINILFQINETLPDSVRIKIPSLLTNDYVSRALDIIEDKLVDNERKEDARGTQLSRVDVQFSEWYSQRLKLCISSSKPKSGRYVKSSIQAYSLVCSKDKYRRLDNRHKGDCGRGWPSAPYCLPHLYSFKYYCQIRP